MSAPSKEYDLAIIGGGINGVGIAADAASRGLSVCLCEQNDLASATSSASTKLVHGGLRYLEHYEFRLVREALNEREVLLKKAPHIIYPLTFIMPHNQQLRPAWLIRLGLFLYDHLGVRTSLPNSKRLNLHHHLAGECLKNDLKVGFSYADCWVDDARLVVLNAQAAAQAGADILTRTRLQQAERHRNHWQLTLAHQSGQQHSIQSRCVINATGPWVSQVNDCLGLPQTHQVRLIKGSHIIVPQQFTGEHAYIFQHHDKRVIFAIPYERHFTLIGTTDVAFDGDPQQVAIDNTEIEYLCDAVNTYFRQAISPSQCVWHYAGVRPLYGSDSDPSAITRDYDLVFDHDGPAALTVYGGKITTYRKLAEHAMQQLEAVWPDLASCTTKTSTLPGGDITAATFEQFLTDFKQQHSWLPADLALRLARSYGTQANQIIGNSQSLVDLGPRLAANLYEREVRYLIQHEWAETAEDILWRRSKLGLHCTPAEVGRLQQWLEVKSAIQCPKKNGRG